LLRGGIRRATDFQHLERVSFDRFESKDGLSSDGVRVAFKDREGNIWFGTQKGVDRFRENKATPFSVKEGLSPNPQVGITSTGDGKVWIFNYPRDTIQHLVGGRIISQRLPSYSPSDSTRVLSIYSHENRVWLGGSFGLAEGRDGKFSYVRVPGFSAGNTVEAITSGSSGDLWVVVWEGNKSRLKRLRNGTWTEFRNRPDLPDGRCRILRGDALGRVWLGFETGDVVVYENDHFRRYSTSDGLTIGKVLSITGDRDGQVWIGGEGGLTHFDGRRFAAVTKENGLPGRSVSAVLEDDDGSLWIAGELGIIRVSQQEVNNALNSRSYRMQRLFLDTTDGLPGLPPQEEPFPTATKSADGRLWFATTDGIAAIDPRRLPMNTLPPPVVIETVTADNRKFPTSTALHFPPRKRNLEISFAAMSFSIPERVLCRYKLEGYESEWHGPVGTRLATYTNLPPGRYRFIVAASNDDGVWNEDGATLRFDIAPAYYQTGWFRAACVAAFFALLWALYQMRIQQLRHEETKLREALQTIPAMAWVARPDGSNEFVNRRWVQYTGLSPEGTAGSGWQSAIHPEDVNRYVAKRRASFASGEPFEDEVRLRCAADGEYRWFLVRAVPLRDKRGNIRKWYGVSADIEDRKRAQQLEAELAHVNRVSMMGELAASLAHELKQPIAAAVTNAYSCLRWLTRDQPDLDEVRRAAERVVRDGRSAGEIIDHIRSLYKKSPPKRELLDVNEIISEMLVLLRSEAYRHSVSMRDELAAGLPRIAADRVQLQQVFMNLMLNAFEAMRDTGGALTIKSQPGEDGQLLISVSDTGVGLPAEKDQIFDAFFTTKSQGSGMGLAISRSIIDAHGGRLWATANLGRGATFHFTVPAAAESMKAPAAEHKRECQWGPARSDADM
jgi:PAS domain S-box-containing protein